MNRSRTYFRLIAPGREANRLGDFALPIFLSAILMEGVLVAGHCILVAFGRDWRLMWRFDLDSDSQFGAWFSSLQLFAAGVVCTLIARRLRLLRWPGGIGVVALALFFLFCSVDEVARLHEGLTRVSLQYSWVPRFNGNHGVWIYAYSLAGLFACLVLMPQLRALWRQFPHPSKAVALGIAIMIAGGVGVEILGYLLVDYSTPIFWRTVEVVVEESMEMIGVSIALYGSLLALSELQG